MPPMANQQPRGTMIFPHFSAVSPRPGAEGGTSTNKKSRNDEKYPLQNLGLCSVLDELPHDVIWLNEIGKESHSNDQLVY